MSEYAGADIARYINSMTTEVGDYEKRVVSP